MKQATPAGPLLLLLLLPSSARGRDVAEPQPPQRPSRKTGDRQGFKPCHLLGQELRRGFCCGKEEGPWRGEPPPPPPPPQAQCGPHTGLSHQSFLLAWRGRAGCSCRRRGPARGPAWTTTAAALWSEMPSATPMTPPGGHGGEHAAIRAGRSNLPAQVARGQGLGQRNGFGKTTTRASALPTPLPSSLACSAATQAKWLSGRRNGRRVATEFP